MPTVARYFRYKQGLFRPTLIGTEKGQIIRTIEEAIRVAKKSAYVPAEVPVWDDNVPDLFANDPNYVPKEADIEEVSGVRISVYFPFFHPEHFVEVEPRPGFVFSVNSNAVDYLRILPRHLEVFKAGELYAFDRGDGRYDYYLPPYVMEGLAEVDWAPHLSKIGQWQSQRRTAMGKADAAIKAAWTRPTD